MMNPTSLKNDAILEALAPLVSNVVQLLMSKNLLTQVSALTGINENRLEQLGQGCVCSSQELLALCSASSYLYQQEESEELYELDELVGNAAWTWMDARYDETRRKIHFLDSLVDASDTDSQEGFLSRYHLFMDASVLCAESMPAFLDNLLTAIEQIPSPLQITVPKGAVRSLQELAADPAQAELTGAERAICQLKRIQDAGLLSVRGDENDSTIMSTFVSAFSRFKPTNSLALLTDDQSIANAVITLNTIGLEGGDILAARLDRNGMVRLWGETEEDRQEAEEAEISLEPDEIPEDPANDRPEDENSEVEDELILLETLGKVLPMDAPLDDLDSSVELNKESDSEMDDDLDDEIITDESELEQFLAISGMLEVDEEDIPCLDETEPEDLPQNETEALEWQDAFETETEDDAETAWTEDTDQESVSDTLNLAPIVDPESNGEDARTNVTLRIGALIEDDDDELQADTPAENLENSWESL